MISFPQALARVPVMDRPRPSPGSRGDEWTAVPHGRHVYYHNRVTNETTWTKPPGFESPRAPAPDPAQRPVPGAPGWFEVAAPGKPSYFHRPATGEVTWTAPRGAFSSSSAPGGSAIGSEAAAAAAAAKEEEDAPDVEFDPDEYEIPDDDDDDEISAGASTRSAVAEKTVRVGGYVVPASALAPETEEAPSGGGGGAGGGGGGGASIPEVASGEIPPSGDEERAKEPNASEDPKEAARAAFRALLAERGVAAKTRWDRIAPKISGDARFRAIATHAERRRVFERYLRDLDATGPGPGPGPGPGDDDDAAGSAQKRKRAAEKEKAPDAETRRAAKLAALERERSARAEAEASCAARRRLRNARERAAEAFAALLAETARDAEEAWDDAVPRLAADPQRRGPSRDSVPPGGFGLADMRDAFEAHKAELRRRAATDCASLLAEALRCADASAFEEGSSDADADAGDGDASLRSFVAACSDERLTSDPRWEACSVAERAAQYVARIEALCGEVGAEMPREVAELRDELAAERQARRRGGGGASGGAGAEEGEVEGR